MINFAPQNVFRGAVLVMIALLLPAATVGSAQTAVPAVLPEGSAADGQRVAYKTVTGQVSAVSLNFIAVEYEHDEQQGTAAEMAFPIDERIKTMMRGLLQSLKSGDRVRVEYREITRSNGTEQFVKRVATNVTYLAPAPAAETLAPADAAAHPEVTHE